MNKTFPSAGKSTPKIVAKVWRKVNGKIYWPNEMKLFLVSRIKEHISVLEGDSDVDSQHKYRVWEQIYKALVRRGMPDSDVRTVKKTWNALRASTIELYRRMETKRRNTRRSIEVSELQRAIHEVIELSHKLKASGNSVMPMPMKIKVELEDESDVAMGDSDPSVEPDSSQSPQLNETQREHQVLQLRSNPVVVLKPLDIDNGEKETNEDDAEAKEPEMPAPLIEPKNVSPPPAIPTPPPSMPTPPLSIGETAAATHQPSQGHVSAPSENEMAPDCRRVYDQLADVELKIKLSQQQKEEQAVEFEREIYARRLAILDAELKKKNIELDFLARSNQRNVNQSLPME